MNVSDLMKNAKNLSDYEFERKLNSLVRENYRYKNLDEKNRKIILALVKKYKPRLRAGRGISYETRKNDLYKIHQNRLKLGLSEEDFKDIKEIINSFK